jgi:hypothetical protein
VYNVRLSENDTKPLEVHLDEKIIMEVFLAQLRLLLGISPIVIIPPSGII